MVSQFEIHKNFIFPVPKKNEPMKISAPCFLYNQEYWNIQFPWKNIGKTLIVRVQNQQKGLLVFRLVNSRSQIMSQIDNLDMYLNTQLFEYS